MEAKNDVRVIHRNGVAWNVTYVTNIDSLASLSAGSSVVSEWVWWSRWGASSCAAVETTVMWWAAKSAAKASTAAEAAAEASTSAKGWATATGKAAAETTTGTTKASTSWEVIGEAILTDLKVASLPVVTVELLDSVACVVWRLESNNSGALWSSIWADVDISTDHGTLTGSLTKKILQILPSNGVWKLSSSVNMALVTG